MSEYLIEASQKAGLFEEFGPWKYYLVSKERLSKILLDPVHWVVWSARWVNTELTSIEQLRAKYGEIEILD